MKAIKPGSIPVFESPLRPMAVAEPSELQMTAAEFLTLKAESERAVAKMGKLRKIIEPELSRVPGQRFSPEGFDKDLHLIDCEKRSVDLAAAEKLKTLAKALAPFVIETRTLDLESAEKCLDEATLKQLHRFVEATPYTSLKTPKRKLTGDGDE